MNAYLLAGTVPFLGTVPASRYAFTVESTQSLPLPYDPWPSPFQASITPTSLPSSSAIFLVPSYGVAASPLLPTTRLGAAPGALTSGVLLPWQPARRGTSPSCPDPSKGPKTGEILSNSGSSFLVSSTVGRCLSSKHDMTRCEWAPAP
ncbi:hypothetical protein SALBM311S_06434 [Streptomyces alboniger]